MLEELFDLSRRQFCSGHGKGHPELLQLCFNVGLLKVGKQRRRWNSPRGAVGRAFNKINDDFCPGGKQPVYNTLTVHPRPQIPHNLLKRLRAKLAVDLTREKRFCLFFKNLESKPYKR